MLDTPEITQTEAQPAATIRLRIPRGQIGVEMGPAMEEVRATLAAQGLVPAGSMFSHHFSMHPDVFDFEVGLPVATAVAPAGRVRPSELPAARVARTTYHGGYEGLGSAWSEFGEWIAAQGLAPAEDLWECYDSGSDEHDPAKIRTVLVRPLRDGALRENP